MHSRELKREAELQQTLGTALPQQAFQLQILPDTGAISVSASSAQSAQSATPTGATPVSDLQAARCGRQNAEQIRPSAGRG
jgi:hypothetical protein